MNKISNIGYQTAILRGAFIDRFSNGVLLFVEDDIRNLIEEYLELERLVKAKEPYQHGICLNDGLLCFTVTSDVVKADIEFRYCPGLDAKNLVTNKVTVTQEAYIWWWRSIMSDILTLVRSIAEKR